MEKRKEVQIFKNSKSGGFITIEKVEIIEYDIWD